MKKVRVFAVLAVVTIFGLVRYWLSENSHNGQYQDTIGIEEKKPDVPSIPVTRNPSHSSDSDEGNLNEVVEPESPSQFSTKQIVEMKTVINKIFEAGEYYNAEYLRNEHYQRLANDPGAVAIIQESLKDPEWAKRRFGPEQSKVRFFGIKVLTYLARSGAVEPLKETAAQVLGKFAMDKDMTADIDLVELLDAYIKVADPSSDSDYKQVFEDLEYDPQSYKRAEMVMKDTVFFHYQKKYEVDVAQEKTKQIFSDLSR